MREPHQTNSVVNVRARARAIGRQLRRHFDDTVQEPVPADMVDLLRKIDEQRAAQQCKRVARP